MEGFSSPSSRKHSCRIRPQEVVSDRYLRDISTKSPVIENVVPRSTHFPTISSRVCVAPKMAISTRLRTGMHDAATLTKRNSTHAESAILPLKNAHSAVTSTNRLAPLGSRDE